MYLASHFRFVAGRKTNAVLKKIEEMKRHPVFKRARFDIYTPSSKPDKLIILLGQVHTVWRGKIGNRERNMIVNCQARLCSYYAYFEQFDGIRSFGGEGLYQGLNTNFHDQRSFTLYKALEKKLDLPNSISLENLPSVAKKILAELGEEWHEELRGQKNLQKIQELAAAVSGQTLFNFLRNGQIENYPIEGERAYQRVLEGITRLGREIEKLERSTEVQSVRSRSGKIKSQQEAEAVQHYNALVLEFNRVIGSDIRERATLEILKEKIQTEPMVVFTMGVGHRKNYLDLVDDYFQDSTAFVFITAPELLMNWWLAIVLPLIVLLLFFLLNFRVF